MGHVIPGHPHARLLLLQLQQAVLHRASHDQGPLVNQVVQVEHLQSTNRVGILLLQHKPIRGSTCTPPTGTRQPRAPLGKLAVLKGSWADQLFQWLGAVVLGTCPLSMHKQLCGQTGYN